MTAYDVRDEATRPEAGFSGRLIVIALLVFVVGLLVYHDKTDFPFFYHPDEPAQARQVLQDDRTYFHPLLLVNTAGVIHRLEGAPASPQQAIEAGRLACGLFSAAALALAVIVCVQNAGWLAGLIGFCALLLDTSLYEYSHLFKESPALNFALAFFCLAATQYERRPALLWATLLGVGCGLAVSAKYVGLLAVPFGLWVLLDPRRAREFYRARRRTIVAGFGLAVLGTVAVVNWQVFWEGRSFLHGLGDEASRLKEWYLEMGSFDDASWSRLSEAVSPVTGALLISYLLSPLFRKRNLNAAQWSFVLLPATLAGISLFFSRTGGHYNAPIILLGVIAAAIGSGWLITFVASRLTERARLAEGVAAAFILVMFAWMEAPGFVTCWQNFRFDSREKLLRYVETQLPASAWIAEEYDARLPDPTNEDRYAPGFNLPQRRFVTKFKKLLPDVMTLEKMREMGITHVVLVWTKRKKSLAEVSPKRLVKLNAADRARAVFYDSLTRQGRLVWECRGGRPEYVRPALRLYEVPPASAVAKNTQP